MNRLLYLLVLNLFLVLVASVGAYAQCSGERWPVKIGTDTDAYQVNLSSATSTTVANLTALSKPKTLPDTTRIKPTEITTWVLSATMVKYVRSYDADYHIVFKDSAGRTMIGEIPDPNCVPANSPFRAAIVHARNQFNAMFTPTTNFQDANIPVQITGVGFFDYNEGQEGIAPNAIELHPITDIVFGATFSLSSSSSTLNITPGSAGSATVTSTVLSGFSSPVSLSATGFPAGASVSFAPPSFDAPGSGSSTMNVIVGSATPAGTYNIAVNGSGGGQTRSIAVNLTVVGGGDQQILGNPGFENGSGNPSPWSVSPAVIDNGSQQASHSGSWKAWLNGYGTVHTDSLSQQVTIPGTATNAALSFWRHIDTTETSTSTAYDTLKVQILNSSGSVLATLATFSNLNAAAGYTQSSFDLLSYKGQSIQISLVGVEDSSLKTSFVLDDFALNVAATGVSPDFAIAASPSALTLQAGSAGTSTVTTSVSGGFNSSITLAATGLPTGATASFSPTSISAPGTGSSVLTISTGASTPSGTYPVVVNASGGGLTHSSPLTLTVSSGGTQQLLVNGGFENGSANPSPWTVTPSVINKSSVQAPHSGSWKAWLNGYGSVHTDTLSQQVTIPSTATNASLSFWRHIDTTETTTTTAYDTLKLQIRNSAGTVLATLATYSNLSAAAGYTQTSFDLTPYKGQTIQVYLIGVEDSSFKTSFVLDDFILNVTTP